MTDYLDDLQSAAEQSEKMANFTNFGRLEIQIAEYKVWKERPDGTRYTEAVSKAEWDVTKTGDRFVKALFIVHLPEINPELTFNYERKVDILGGKNSDWAKIVQPSAKKVFGDVPFSNMTGRYVEVQDVPQVRDADWNTIKFLRVFPGRAECEAAWREKAGKDESQTTAPPPPQTATPAQPVPAPQATIPEAVPASTDAIPENYDATTWVGTMKPAIISELQSGKTPAQVANDYGVGVQFVAQYVGQ